MAWTLAEAKDQLSEVVRRAVDQGPQTISVRGRETAVLISKAAFEALSPTSRPKSFTEHLLAFPKVEEMEVERDRSPARTFEF